MIGRPSLATPELIDVILQRLSQGEPLAKICADEGMPHYATVRRWEDQDDEFRALSTRARIDGTHYMADDCVRIADDPSLEPADKRVRVDTRLRLIGKWNAKVYGDAAMIKHADSEGNRLPELDDVSRFVRLASLAAELRLLTGNTE